MLTVKRSFVGASLCLVVLPASLATFMAQSADLLQRDAIEAVWKPQSAVFEYRSEGRVYSCDILKYKIRMILRRLGAHERLELRRSSCRDLGGSARFEVLMESPVVATEDNVLGIATYSSEDKLIARMRGVQLRSSADLERFPAVWEPISFRRDHGLYLEGGDCALVQQLRRQILPRMSVQVTKDIGAVDCLQELTGLSRPRLTVLALLPANPQPLKR